MSSPLAQLWDSPEHLASEVPLTLTGWSVRAGTATPFCDGPRGQLLAPGPGDKSPVPLAENPVWAAWREAMVLPLAACLGLAVGGSGAA